MPSPWRLCYSLLGRAMPRVTDFGVALLEGLKGAHSDVMPPMVSRQFAQVPEPRTDCWHRPMTFTEQTHTVISYRITLDSFFPQINWISGNHIEQGKHARDGRTCDQSYSFVPSKSTFTPKTPPSQRQL